MYDLAQMGESMLANSPTYRMFCPDPDGRSPFAPLDVQLSAERLYSAEFRTTDLEMLVHKAERLLARGSCRCRGSRALVFSGSELLSPRAFLDGAFRVYGKLAPMTSGDEVMAELVTAREACSDGRDARCAAETLAPLASPHLVPGVDMLLDTGETEFFPLAEFQALGPEGVGAKFLIVGKPIVWREAAKQAETPEDADASATTDGGFACRLAGHKRRKRTADTGWRTKKQRLTHSTDTDDSL